MMANMSKTAAGRDTIWSSWCRFWFQPRDPKPLSAARIGIATVACWYLGTYTWDVVAWFGPQGLLPPSVVSEMLRFAEVPSFRVSPLFLTDQPAMLLGWTLFGALAGIALLAGFFTRIAALLTWLCVVGLVHRGPVLSGPLEALLSPLLFYLAISPSGAYWSWDARRKPSDVVSSSGANFGIRLIQVHLTIACLGLALAKHASPAWREATGVWWLTSWREVAVLDWGFLHAHLILVQIWSHLALAIEFAFPVLVWIPSLRRVVLVLACVNWLLFAMLSGLTGFYVLLIVSSVVFLRLAGRHPGRSAAT